MRGPPRLLAPLASPFLAMASAAGDHHAATPSGSFEYVLVGVGSIIVAVVIVQAVRYTFWPQERRRDHIKHRILRDEGTGR